jgi:hypothetical protein
MLRFWNRKDDAVKKWRSRAWSIDPKVTNLTIIKADSKLERMDIARALDFNLDFNFGLDLDFPKLLKVYPEYFEAIADIE